MAIRIHSLLTGDSAGFCILEQSICMAGATLLPVPIKSELNWQGQVDWASLPWQAACHPSRWTPRSCAREKEI